VRSEESASNVSAQRRSVQCTSRHTTVLTCLYRPTAYLPTEAQGRSLRAQFAVCAWAVMCAVRVIHLASADSADRNHRLAESQRARRHGVGGYRRP
jgi:hypothetical protein